MLVCVGRVLGNQSLAIVKKGLLAYCRVHSRGMACITFTSENVKGGCPGYLNGEASKNNKGLIVLQDWWGINEQIKDEAKMIGVKGNFVTLVPDLYRGQLATDKEEAGHLMGELDWQGAVKDIQGAAKYLLANGCKKVGVTGFCMGGTLSLAAAALLPGEISASAPFYSGIPSVQLCDVSTIKCPVQAHFGEKDDIQGFSSPDDAKAFEDKMRGKDFKLFMYPCGHAFTSQTGPLGNYDEKQCDLALGRMVEFMNKNLE